MPFIYYLPRSRCPFSELTLANHGSTGWPELLLTLRSEVFEQALEILIELRITEYLFSLEKVLFGTSTFYRKSTLSLSEHVYRRYAGGGTRTSNTRSTIQPPPFNTAVTPPRKRLPGYSTTRSSRRAALPTTLIERAFVNCHLRCMSRIPSINLCPLAGTGPTCNSYEANNRWSRPLSSSISSASPAQRPYTDPASMLTLKNLASCASPRDRVPCTGTGPTRTAQEETAPAESFQHTYPVRIEDQSCVKKCHCSDGSTYTPIYIVSSSMSVSRISRAA